MASMGDGTGRGGHAMATTRTGAPALLGGMLLPLLLAAATGPAAAGAALVTSCNALIPTPGTYVLANDLDCPSSGAGIRISASNVHLDLNGHAITGAGCSGTAV